MKHITYTLIITFLLSFTGQRATGMIAQVKATQAKVVEVTVTNTAAKECIFQPEGTTGYDRTALDVRGKHTFCIELESPAYYRYVDGKQKFHTVYLVPGAKSEITENAGGVSFAGDNADINVFINQHRYLGRTSKQVPLYSAEWQKECRNELEGLFSKLEQSGLPAEFVKRHRLYYRFAYYNQQLESPAMSRVFMKTDISLPEHYYDFLKDMRFDDPALLSIPKWFNTLVATFEEMEKQGLLPIDKDRYMQLYANRIDNGQVRSAFLVRLLDLTLQKGYSDNFPAYMESLRAVNFEEKDKATLKELTANYDKLKEANKTILRGCTAPGFTAMDIDGKEYKLSDFAGKVVVLDFWFTGCVPCKAEMPFMEKIAESMKGDSIQFISMSLDSGTQLMAGWKAMVKDKTGAVLNLNVPQGFKSELAKKFGIRSVPRIVIVNKNGKIYDSNALRPSDPKLKQALEALLGKSTLNERMKKEVMKLMQADTAAKKDSIFRSASAAFKQVPEVTPTLNMMLYQVMIAYAKEKNYEAIDTYQKGIAPSEFRRDMMFVIGNTFVENGNSPKAEPFLKEAAETTEEYLKRKPDDKDELDKSFITSKLYGILLANQGRTEEAAKWVEQAYRNGGQSDFDLIKSYAGILSFRKEYDKALPLLEDIFKRGMGSDELKTQLKKAYTGRQGSDKGFDSYLEGLLKEAESNELKKIQAKMVNDPAPLFTLRNINGEEVSLAALKGKVVILDFWATWCGPCKNSFPAMQKAVDKYKDNPKVAFLFIDTWENSKDPQPAVKAFIKEHGYTFNVLFDLKDSVSQKSEVIASYGAKGIPAKYVIDKEGNIRFRLLGFSGSDEQVVKELSTMIEMLL